MNKQDRLSKQLQNGSEFLVKQTLKGKPALGFFLQKEGDHLTPTGVMGPSSFFDDWFMEGGATFREYIMGTTIPVDNIINAATIAPGVSIKTLKK